MSQKDPEFDSAEVFERWWYVRMIFIFWFEVLDQERRGKAKKSQNKGVSEGETRSSC